MNARDPREFSRRDVLLVDGSERSRASLASAMENRGYSVITCNGAGEGLRAVAEFSPHYVVTELKLPDDCGLQFISRLKNASPGTTLIVLTGHASIATAIEAIKRGAINYLIKPASAEQIVAAFSRHDGDQIASYDRKFLSTRRLEWEYINWVLMEHDNNLSAAARALSMHRKTLQRKLTKRVASG
ncbi:MAG: response regulator [Betaproteobacteria bacterium]|nr:response regulator [Betaproteobacteria bacterium]